MLDYETYCRIQQLRDVDKLNVSQIADTMGLSRRTVARAMARDRYEQRKVSKRTSILDPYKETVQRLLEKHPYSGAQILLQLKELGYNGGYTTLKDYVHLMRPPRRTAYLTLSFAPGECAQVDWGSWEPIAVGNTRRRLSFFVMVLCYSRIMYVEFTVLQTMEHFLGCHEHAFEFFGGVPARIMVDNLKSAVLQRPVGAAPVLNPKYFDFARHYGFTISPCAPGKGNEKGRVERGVGYVKKNFLNGLELADFSAIHAPARTWLETVANNRLHGETKERPVDLFVAEKKLLKPLPASPYDSGTVLQVRASSRFRVTYDSNRYSVPAEYASAALTLKAYPERICIYATDKLIARHVRSYDRNLDFENQDHVRQLVAERHKAREQKIYTQFLNLSPKADAYYKEMVTRNLNAKQHVRKIVALSEIYGTDQVARAIDDAFVFYAFNSEYIANILQSRLRKLPEPGPLHLTRASDAMEIEVTPPDLSMYDRGNNNDNS